MRAFRPPHPPPNPPPPKKKTENKNKTKTNTNTHIKNNPQHPKIVKDSLFWFK